MSTTNPPTEARCVDLEQARKSILEAAQKLRADSGANPCDSTTHVIAIEAVNDLIDALGSSNVQSIESALERLGAQRDSEIYHKVGHMARSLHDSLHEFALTLKRDNKDMASTNIPDAADKLEAVMKMTYEAAERTMNLVDEQTSIIKTELQTLAQVKNALDNPSISPLALREIFRNYLSAQERGLAKLEKLSSDVLMAQEFQDLTGQSLRKVVTLVQDLERNLVGLVELFGLESKGEILKDEPKPQTAAGQDDVDALLNSFGF